jgi:hypothetical protein
MKKLFMALGFKKADEMEKSIQLKSIRLAWVFTVAVLFVWCLYESLAARADNERLNYLPLILLVSQNLILCLSQLFYRARMTDGEDEEKESRFGKALAIIAIIVVAGAVSAALARMIMG